MRGHYKNDKQGGMTSKGLAVLLDLGEEVEFAGGGEEAGFDGVGGEFAELVEREAEVGMGEGELVEQGGAEHGWVV